MASGGGAPNQAYATAIAQAIARGQGTPAQRAAFLGQVSQQMQASAEMQAAQHQLAQAGGGIHWYGPGGSGVFGGGHPQMPFPPAAGGGTTLGPLPNGPNDPGFSSLYPPPSGGAGLAPPVQPVPRSGPFPPSGGAGLAPPGHPVHVGGPPGLVNPGGPIQRGGGGPTRPGGPVRAIGPARPPGAVRPGGPVRAIGPARPAGGTTGGRRFGL